MTCVATRGGPGPSPSSQPTPISTSEDLVHDEPASGRWSPCPFGIHHQNPSPSAVTHLGVTSLARL
eukprot:CAMPEP_0180151644 /NCGR_PEP_ID=MMETSP0986-20121125/22264_1 /TAXON_ID=697907 /ORGANISM="non described non described, Strain CCMP2293" /LENGTH=65 /DNA_ID=CAMNT_0022099003 /DNA_START=50 /DNA_END=247 /DNA_ORIENTATION=+